MIPKFTLTSEGKVLARVKTRDEAFRVQDALQRQLRKPVLVRF